MFEAYGTSWHQSASQWGCKTDAFAMKRARDFQTQKKISFPSCFTGNGNRCLLKADQTKFQGILSRIEKEIALGHIICSLEGNWITQKYTSEMFKIFNQLITLKNKNDITSVSPEALTLAFSYSRLLGGQQKDPQQEKIIKNILSGGEPRIRWGLLSDKGYQFSAYRNDDKRYKVQLSALMNGIKENIKKEIDRSQLKKSLSFEELIRNVAEFVYVVNGAITMKPKMVKQWVIQMGGKDMDSEGFDNPNTNTNTLFDQFVEKIIKDTKQYDKALDALMTVLMVDAENKKYWFPRIPFQKIISETFLPQQAQKRSDLMNDKAALKNKQSVRMRNGIEQHVDEVNDMIDKGFEALKADFTDWETVLDHIKKMINFTHELYGWSDGWFTKESKVYKDIYNQIDSFYRQGWITALIKGYVHLGYGRKMNQASDQDNAYKCNVLFTSANLIQSCFEKSVDQKELLEAKDIIPDNPGNLDFKEHLKNTNKRIIQIIKHVDGLNLKWTSEQQEKFIKILFTHPSIVDFNEDQLTRFTLSVLESYHKIKALHRDYKVSFEVPDQFQTAEKFIVFMQKASHLFQEYNNLPALIASGISNLKPAPHIGTVSETNQKLLKEQKTFFEGLLNKISPSPK